MYRKKCDLYRKKCDAQKKMHADALAALGLGATDSALAAADLVKKRAERKAKRRTLGFKLVRKKGKSRKKISPIAMKLQKDIEQVEAARKSRARRKAMKKIRRVVKGIGVGKVLVAAQATSAFAGAGKKKQGRLRKVGILPAPGGQKDYGRVARSNPPVVSKAALNRNRSVSPVAMKGSSIKMRRDLLF